jgi:hypothetical protein|tara:strand:+ start:2247 stop:2609 length:363 start_codon:yes stop_codon:yes gene_type:complete
MSDKRSTNEFDGPTQKEDWVGAAEVRPSEKKREQIKTAMMFHVFRSSKEHSLFVVTDKEDAVLPDCPDGGSWAFLKKFEETGQPRIGFSEREAIEDIKKNGYHLNKITIESSVKTASSSS